MTNLLQRLKSAGSVKTANILSESEYFMSKDLITTDLPILNLAFSGKLDGGLVPGITVFAGESKTFKTMLGLYCIRAYQKKYPDSVVLYYDTEFGTTPKYLKYFNIDTDKIIHIPVHHVEELKFDIVKRLKEIKRGNKVFVFLDSLGALASKKEIEDAEDEKSAADMTRAKSIRSLLRIINPYITMLDIPCIIINHVYKTMDLFAKNVVPGGSAITYVPNQIFIISKSQEKEKGENVGHKFTINIEKSRYVKEKSKFPFIVYSDGRGLKKYSGMFDLALEFGLIKEVNQGWYMYNEEKKRRLELEDDENIWKQILETDEFKHRVEREFVYIVTDEEHG